MASPAPSALFQEVYTSFRDSLPDREKQFLAQHGHSSAQDMAVATRKDIDKVTDKSKRTRLESGLFYFYHFAKKLDPYFKVVTIFVQSNPEYSALVWGTLRLLFQMSSNYAEYFDKLSQMLSEIAEELPAYEKHILQLEKTAEQLGSTFLPRLLEGLADVYTTIVRFCHRAIAIFCSIRNTRLLIRLSAIGRRMWQPFDLEFDELISDLRIHKKRFLHEVKFESLNGALRFYAEYDKDQQERENARVQEEVCSRIEKLGRWIDPPEWKKRYEDLVDSRANGTCGWVSQENAYTAWKARNSKPVISIQGKPGYGKSTLCTAIIDDLQQVDYLLNKPSGPSIDGVAAYYFFDQLSGSKTPDLAIRSILAQALSHLRKSPEAIDIASALYKERGVGQRRASNQEISAILQLLLERFPGMYIVLDAVDECECPADFLDTLFDITSGFDNCFLLFLSRPTVAFSEEVLEKIGVLNLENIEHLEDMEMYLEPQIRGFIRKSALLANGGPGYYIDKILPRANGMFLWVKLLVSYLRLNITVAHRIHIIENLNRFEELDALYKAIWQKLEQQNPGEAGEIITRGLRWVVGARRKLHIDEFSAAVTIPLDRQAHESDVIPDFERSLGSIFGGLVELRPNKTVDFIHLSAHEYFSGEEQKSYSTTRKSLSQPSSVDIHTTISASCLSYLCYTLPGEPLSGNATITPDATHQNKKFPLLSYAASYWPVHIVAAIVEAFGSSATDGVDAESVQHALDLLVKFLYDKSRVTAWIEASWLFGRPPNICFPLPGALGTANQFKIDIQQLVQDFSTLSRDIRKVNESWAYALEKTPNLIWDPSVQIFAKSRFLNQAQGRIIPCTRPEDVPHDGLLLKSHVSGDGKEVGIIRLIPPRSMLDSPRAAIITGWMARYDIWWLPSNAIICTVVWDLDPSALKVFLVPAQNGYAHWWPWAKFRIPFAIADNLRTVIVLNSVVRLSISPGDSAQRSTTAWHNTFDIFRQFQVPSNKPLLDESCEIDLSSDGRTAVVFRRNSWLSSTSLGELAQGGVIAFFRDRNFENASSPPEYTCFASWFLSVPVEQAGAFLRRAVAFDHLLRRVALCAFLPWNAPLNCAVTYLWDFGHLLDSCVLRQTPPRDDVRVIYGAPIDDIQFSRDGKYIIGKDMFDGNPRMVVLADDLETQRLLSGCEDPASSRHIDKFRQPRDQILMRSSHLFDSEQTAVQYPGSVIFGRSDGFAQVSQLTQLDSEGAIILSSLGENGKLTSQTLARLPDELRETSSAVLLNTIGEHEGVNHVKILLNARERNKYSLNDVGDLTLPIIVERAKSSVAIHTLSSRDKSGLLTDDGRLTIGDQSSSPAGGTNS